MNINVKTVNEEIIVQISPDDTIFVLKQMIFEMKGFDINKQRLIFNGNILINSRNLSSYEIVDGSVLHLSIQSSTVQGTTDTPTTESSNNNGWMDEMLNNPLIQNFLSNPDLVRSILTNSPWSRNLIENNPEMKQILESPETIQLMTDMIRNPSLRDEFIRNSDRAISQIENIPGGFNLLHRVHNQMGDPYEMFHQQNNNNENTQQESVPPQTSPGNTPLPNPWAPQNNNNQTRNNNLNFGQNGFNFPFFNPNSQQTNQTENQTQNQTNTNQRGFPLFFNPYLQQTQTQNQTQTNQQTTNTQTMPQMPLFRPLQPQPLIPNTNLPPEKKYEVQLRQLDSMGFTDIEANIQALIESKGNVERAISQLFEGK